MHEFAFKEEIESQISGTEVSLTDIKNEKGVIRS